MPTKRISIPQVAVQVPLALKGHLEVFEGILQYARLHGPWRLYRMEGRPGEQKLRDIKRWGCTGIIAGACELEEAELIAATNLPVVLFEPSLAMRHPQHPLAGNSAMMLDSRAVGVMAAGYFLDRGYRNFAFVGEGHELYWSIERGESFAKTVASRGAKCVFYPRLSVKERRDWAVEQPRMCRWLAALPKPVAVFVAMDGRASQVLDACMAANITVPDEVAVLGVDDDLHICEATFPTLSSIQTNGRHVGCLMAEHLDKLMRGKTVPVKIFPAEPTRVVTRRSTDATAIEDKQVAQALEFIWSEAGHRNLKVPDVVKRMGSSRRFAEINFKAVTGRTIMEEIKRVKLEKVCGLLRETNLSIGEITEQCGFIRESHLAFLFKQHFGTTMTSYRTAERRGFNA